MTDELDEPRESPIARAEDLEVADEAAEDVRGGDGTTPTETLSIPYTKPKYEYKP